MSRLETLDASITLEPKWMPRTGITNTLRPFLYQTINELNVEKLITISDLENNFDIQHGRKHIHVENSLTKWLPPSSSIVYNFVVNFIPE